MALLSSQGSILQKTDLLKGGILAASLGDKFDTVHMFILLNLQKYEPGKKSIYLRLGLNMHCPRMRIP